MNTRAVLYSWDHQCEVCFKVHVPTPCCQGCPCGTARIPVQAERDRPAGTISEEEHNEVWRAYQAKYRGDQSAKRVAERGGFGYVEATKLLGRPLTTWESQQYGGDGAEDDLRRFIWGAPGSGRWKRAPKPALEIAAQRKVSASEVDANWRLMADARAAIPALLDALLDAESEIARLCAEPAGRAPTMANEHKCVARLSPTFMRPTCAYLADGMKIVVVRDPETTGGAWLEHKAQDEEVRRDR